MVLSDLHGHREAFVNATKEAKQLEVDLFVLCGDITHFGHVQQAKPLFEPLFGLGVPVFYVFGNCDLSTFLSEPIENAQSLHGSCVKLGGYSFVGVGGAPSSYLKTPLEFPEQWLMDSLNRGFESCPPHGKLVVVSHVPPYNVKVDLAYMNKHIGSTSIRRFVDEHKPVAVLCGHVHEAAGTDHIGETLVVNSGPAKDGSYALVELGDSVSAVVGTFKA
jgi:Icc-related predicted phosphoesterase